MSTPLKSQIWDGINRGKSPSKVNIKLFSNPNVEEAAVNVFNHEAKLMAGIQSKAKPNGKMKILMATWTPEMQAIKEQYEKAYESFRVTARLLEPALSNRLIYGIFQIKVQLILDR